MIILVIIGIITLGLSLLPAAIAADKGRDFLGWWLLGLVAWPIVMVCALVITDNRTARCSQCGVAVNDVNMRFCPACGVQFLASPQ